MGIVQAPTMFAVDSTLILHLRLSIARRTKTGLTKRSQFAYWMGRPVEAETSPVANMHSMQWIRRCEHCGRVALNAACLDGDWVHWHCGQDFPHYRSAFW